MSLGWKLLKKKKAFTTPWIKVEEWTVRNHHGKRSKFFINRGIDVVVVLGMTHDHKIVLIKQYYLSLQKKVISLVAGYRDHGHTPLAIAKKELQEEAGCVAKKFVYLGKGIKGKWMTGSVYYYLALGVQKNGGQHLEDAEDIEVLFVPFKKFCTMVDQDKINDIFALPGVYRALRYLEKNIF